MLFLPIVGLLLAGCNPIQAVKDFFTPQTKEEQTEEEKPAPIPEPTPEPAPQPEPEPEPEPEPSPFSFEQIDYELKEGVERAKIQGYPWINSNYQGQLEKIEKPSVKDDFYASVNYEDILEGNDGLFGQDTERVNNALENIFNANSGVGNSKLFAKAKDAIVDGNCQEIAEYFDNFDYDEFVKTSSLFESGHSFFTLFKDEENKYYVKFNDGFYYGETSFGSIAMLGDYISDQRDGIWNELSEAFALDISASDYSDIVDFEYKFTYKGYGYYYYNKGDEFSEFTFGSSATSFLDNALRDSGLSEYDSIFINTPAVEALKLIPNYAKRVIKNSLITRLAFEMRFLSGADHYRKISQYVSQTQYINESDVSDLSDEEIAPVMAKRAFSNAYERAYLEQEGKPERKAEVVELIEKIIAGYKEMAKTYDWLDSKSRNGLNAKLNNMKYEACYSDKIKSYPLVDETGLNSMDLLDVYSRYQNWLYDLKFSGKYEDNEIWSYMPSYTVNAFYMPNINSFVILNGIVAGIPIGDEVERVLAAIGTVIGHEMSHSIDSTGSQFDKDGNYVDWWGSTTKTKFNEKVTALREFYNQIGITNFTSVRGSNVDGEATADMGGMHVCLEIAKTIDNFDYDLYFRTYAKLWLHHTYDGNGLIERNKDTHPFEYLRVNVTLAQFEEFFETYNIKYGDKMYIPEDQRVAIW